MNEEYEQQYLKLERTHPWFVRRRELVASLSGDIRNARVLDVGCGSGAFLEYLHSKGCSNLRGLDFSPVMIEAGKFRIDKGDAESLPYKNESFEFIFALDIIEHLNDDESAVSEIQRVLRPGSRAIITVPAFPFLWSKHDEINQHKRRYTKKSLRVLLSKNFVVERITYWNFFSFLPTALLKILRRNSSGSDFVELPRIAMKTYDTLLKIENKIARSINLPVGTSLVAVIRKT